MSSSALNIEDSATAASAADVRPVPRISIQAFCESPELAEAVEAAAADRRMARAHVKVHSGGIPAAVEFYQSAATPNLILVESKQPRDRLDADLDRLAEV
jgi:pilus assembly protein CpaE